jgi:hypothetical protein
LNILILWKLEFELSKKLEARVNPIKIQVILRKMDIGDMYLIKGGTQD